MTPMDEQLNQKWESLGFTNDFIIEKVMQDEELRSELFHCLLQWKWDSMALTTMEQEYFEDGRADGRAEGRAEGRADTLDAATAFMRENGIPMELISKFRSSFSEAVQV